MSYPASCPAITPSQHAHPISFLLVFVEHHTTFGVEHCCVALHAVSTHATSAARHVANTPRCQHAATKNAKPLCSPHVCFDTREPRLVMLLVLLLALLLLVLFLMLLLLLLLMLTLMLLLLLLLMLTLMLLLLLLLMLTSMLD
jgi:hypothetical protein